MRKLKTAATYAVLILLIAAASQGEVYHMRPFGYGVFVALAAYFNPLPLALGLAAAEMLAEPTVYTLVECLLFGGVMTAACYLRKKFAFSLYYLPLASVAASLGCLYAVLAGKTALFTELLSCAFSALTAFLGFAALKPLCVYKLKYRLLEPELAALGLLAAIYGLSLSALTFYGFNPAVAIAMALIAVCGVTAGTGAACLTAACFGLGIGLPGFDPGYLAALALAAAVFGFFAAAPRPISGLAGVIGFIMSAYLFDSFGPEAPMLALSALVGAAIFLLIPSKALKALGATVQGGKRPALRYLINRTRYELAAKLDDTAVIFSEMGGVIAESDPPPPVKLGSALRCTVCDGCAERKTCKVTDEAADKLMELVVATGRASVSELPAAFTDGCVRLAAVIGAADNLSRVYAENERRRASGREAKRLIGEHYAGISSLLADMGKRTAVMIGDQTELEDKISEELTYRNVVCGETLIAGEGEATTVTMVVRSDSVDRSVIERTLEKMLKTRFKLTVSESGLSGFSIVFAAVAPKLDVLFAAASKPRSDKSGDTHAFNRIGRRFMMALSDGMGTGEKAYRTSETAIGLVENFYKAGFPDDLILKSVNKFLSLGADESFSAVDIAVVDLADGTTDVIKIGTPPAYIKNEDTVTVVRGQALPLGIVDEIRPAVLKRRLNCGETVVFVSDGVSDCFEGDGLADYVNSLPGHNPQAIADAILARAVEANKRADDMTVVCARLFERV